MRRKKKTLLNILKILLVIGVIFIIYWFFFRQEKEIGTANTINNKGEVINVEPANITYYEEITLPENIQSVDGDDSTNKTYSPTTESSNTYFISILSDAGNEVSLLIGNDSAKLLNENSPINIGMEYKVAGIQTTLKAVFYFEAKGYDYPIFLMLSKDGTVSYVDIEKSYRTGEFTVDGVIENIPTIDTIYETTVEENGETYPSAILVGTDGQGYEFELSMIGK